MSVLYFTEKARELCIERTVGAEQQTTIATVMTSWKEFTPKLNVNRQDLIG